MTEERDIDPLVVAARLEEVARGLQQFAAIIRSQVAQNNSDNSPGSRDTGGANDRVQMAVVGPNGHVKQRTDTGEVK